MQLRKALLNNVLTFRKDTRGQIGVWFAIIALPLLALTTFSIDYTAAITERTDLLNSLDNAALAAVLRQNITDEERKVFAEEYFWLNYGDSSQTELDVIDASAGRVELAAVTKVPTTISASLGIEDITIRESSVSELTQGDVICMLVLDPDGERSFEVTTGARLDAKRCSVQVNSTHSRAAVVDHGGVAKAKSFCVAGGAVGGYAPFVNTECAIIPDPYVNRKAPEGDPCITQGDVDEQLNAWQADVFKTDLQPGTYCGGLTIGGINGRKIVNFTPGTYIIKDGPLSFKSGSIATAEGVTFVLSGKDAVLDIDNGSIITIKAPKTGEYAGLAFFQDADGRQNNPASLPDGESIIRSGGILTIVGTAYLPTQKISFVGGSLFASQAPATSFIGYHISIGDGARISVAVDHQAVGLPPIQPRSDEGARLSR